VLLLSPALITFILAKNGRLLLRSRFSVPRLSQILDALEAFHGAQAPGWPTDPELFLVWWQCGYPPSEERCGKGWEALDREVGAAPDNVLSATPGRLARALRAGGIVPELRAARLKGIARKIRDEYGANLRAALGKFSLAESRATLKRFPGIGDPGADRILLFAGIAPVAAVPSSCPHVLLRIASGREPARYTAAYREAQQILQAGVPDTLEARRRAYLLLQIHGRQVCKRTKPKCDSCPVADACAFFAAKTRSPG
jgi:endonuclease III